MKKINEMDILRYSQSEYPVLYNTLVNHKTHKNKRITFIGYNYLKGIYLDQSPYIVIKKSTQAGITEWIIVNAITKAIKGRSVFYVLPTDSLKNRFVKNRIDRTIEYSPYYRDMVKAASKNSESMSLKHIGTGSIAFVASNSPVGFTEYPADDFIVDELDMCNQENLAMGIERLSASTDKRIIKIGNPMITGLGIDEEFNNTDCKKWFIKCECGEWINPDFFRHVVQEMDKDLFILRDDEYERGCGRDINLICHKCHRPFNRHSEGNWVSERQSERSGYHINKLFSSKMTIEELVERFEEGQINESKKQRFYRGDLGLAYTGTGAKITIEDLNDCRDMTYVMPDKCDKTTVMGIDVGNRLHVRIDELLPDSITRAVYIGTVISEEEVIDLYRRYNVKVACIDSLPEKRLAVRLCAKLKGMYRVFYGDVKKESIDAHRKILTIDRTSSLDDTKEIIVSKRLILPGNAATIPLLTKDGISEYYSNMTASTRVYDEEKEIYRWIESGADHYFHAENYKNLARKLLTAWGGK